MEVGRPAPWLRGSVSSYYGFRELAPRPIQRLEGPGVHVVLLISFGAGWLINGESRTSFVGGLHARQVTTEHRGQSFGIHIDLLPPAAWSLFGLPMDELANRTVDVVDVWDEPNLPERLCEAGGWQKRFDLLDELFSTRLAARRAPSAEVLWAWRRLVETHGRLRIARLTHDLGWSRKRLVSRFRDEVGLPPKAVARLLRFDRAKMLATAGAKPDWAAIAVEAGYYDQSHLTNDFRHITGRTPETFFQDESSAAA